MRRGAAAVALASVLAASAAARDAGDVDRLHAAGVDAMSQMGAHMHEGAHMRMTEARAPTAADLERAHALLVRLREAVSKYRDSGVAIADGFEPFLPTVPQPIVHFTNTRETAREYAGSFDPQRPGSLLYERSGDGWRLVGVMYSAAPQSTPADLDERIPLGVARWHAHVNVCLPAGIELADLVRGEIGAGDPRVAGRVDAAGGALADVVDRRYGFMADGRFGFAGSIADAASCASAGGHFLPQAWGWMVHVYPFAGDDPTVAFGLSTPGS